VRDTNTAKHHGLNHWLMLDLIERKIQLHTDRLYEERGHAEGRELEDWLKAASEVLRTSILRLVHEADDGFPPFALAGRSREEL
jgi:hypothetical protein